MRKTNRKILLIGTLVLSVGLCQQVTSYTSAEVQNSLDMKISVQEDALIAMPNVIKVKVKKDITVTTTLTDKGEQVQERVCSSINSSNFDITNNMNQTIDIVINLQSGFKKRQNGLYIKRRQNLVILPGDTKNVKLRVDDDIESNNIDAIISARWKNGSAEILNNIDIDVETDIKRRQIDNRTPPETEKIVEEEESNKQRDIQEEPTKMNTVENEGNKKIKDTEEKEKSAKHKESENNKLVQKEDDNNTETIEN